MLNFKGPEGAKFAFWFPAKSELQIGFCPNNKQCAY